ncbi:MAG: hypothetical protein WAN14_10130 [Candidatus Acidiferrales bacterium]
MELLRAHAEKYVRSISRLSISTAIFHNTDFWRHEKDLAALIAELEEIEEFCLESELPVTLTKARNLKTALERGLTESSVREVTSPQSLLLQLFEIRSRLEDELETKLFFQLPYERKKLFDEPLAGWEECITRFPEIRTDVSEMAKCFALSRYAASVFHSTQVIEHALLHLLRFLENNDPKAGWSAACNALKKIVQDTKYAELKPHEKKHFALIEQIYGTTVSLNNTWRSKISHAANKLTLLTADFSPDVAEEITMAARSFVRRLATELPKGKISD